MTPRANPRIRHHSRGFSMLEALVALALMGLLLGALGQVTAQWLPNWNTGLVRVQRNEQVAIALDRLVADLSNALHVSPNRQIGRPLFEGTERGVVFVRPAIGPGTNHGLEIVRMMETRDLNGGALVRTRAPFAPLPTGDLSVDPIPFADPVVLLRAPLHVTFAYRVGKVWRSQWRESTLPQAIRLIVRNGPQATVAVATATPVHVDLQSVETAD